jgi:hypothetical protein
MKPGKLNLLGIFCFFCIITIPCVIISACESIKPTEIEGTEPSLKITRSSLKYFSGNVDASVEIFLTSGSPEYDYDEVTNITIPSTAINVKYKVDPPIETWTECDPLGGAVVIFKVDNQSIRVPSSGTGWVSLPNGSHTFFISASASHSTDPSACSECLPFLLPCESHAYIRLVITWD